MLVTLHHTAFGESATRYGKRVIFLYRLEGTTPDFADIVEEAFVFTNDPGVTKTMIGSATKMSIGNCYSLSVGDIVEHLGQFAIIGSSGFTPISEDEFHGLFDAWAKWDDTDRRFEMGYHGFDWLVQYRQDNPTILLSVDQILEYPPTARGSGDYPSLCDLPGGSSLRIANSRDATSFLIRLPGDENRLVPMVRIEHRQVTPASVKKIVTEAIALVK